VKVWGKTAGVCDDFPQGLLVDELAQTEHRSEGPQLDAIPFTLPALKDGQQWERLLDIAEESAAAALVDGQQPYGLPGRSMVVLRTRAQPEEAQQPEATAAAANR